MGRDAAALTPKEEAFVAEYMVCLNATKAFLAAGYKAGKQPGVDAGKVMARPRVKTAIAQAKAERAERFRPTQDRVIEELAALAFADPREVVEWTGGAVWLRPSGEIHPEAAASIASISAGQHGPKVKFHDKTRALQLLLEHFGLKPGEHPPATPDLATVLAVAQALAAAQGGPARDGTRPDRPPGA